ncbi:MAG: hypothetical protein HZA50_01650 [Planctomycetes bacterium]|nr:hypothetical protein [Planctomycetota bacterium]
MKFQIPDPATGRRAKIPGNSGRRFSMKHSSAAEKAGPAFVFYNNRTLDRPFSLDAAFEDFAVSAVAQAEL